MSIGARINQALGWTADRFVIGTLTSVASLGIVTVPAALAAGVAASRQASLQAAVPAFVRAFRKRLRSGLLPGVTSALFLLSALISSRWATAAPESSEMILAYALFVLSGVAAVTTSVIGAALLEMGAGPAPRNVVVLAFACPGPLAAVIALTALGVAAASIAPILLLPAVGLVTFVIAGIKVSYERRLLRSAAQPS